MPPLVLTQLAALEVAVLEPGLLDNQVKTWKALPINDIAPELVPRLARKLQEATRNDQAARLWLAQNDYGDRRR